MNEEDASRQVEIVKLILEKWTGDLDVADYTRETPM